MDGRGGELDVAFNGRRQGEWNGTGRVLVTGCAGFIGSHLSERLVAMGCDVVGVSSTQDAERVNDNILILQLLVCRGDRANCCSGEHVRCCSWHGGTRGRESRTVASTRMSLPSSATPNLT